jgi:hypothetical protein
MRLDTPYGPTANKETTDPAMIREAVLALGKATRRRVHGRERTSPRARCIRSALERRAAGLVFAPQVYLAPTGEVFLAESFEAVAFQGTKESIRAKWIPASVALTKWATTAD